MVKNVLIKVPLKSSNKVKTLDLKKNFFTDRLYNQMCNQPSTRKQEHESKTIVLRIMTPTNSNPMTLRVFWWRK